LIFLFPPYTAGNKNVKFRDFIFNPEKVNINSGKTYTYSVNSLLRSLTAMDTSDAIDVYVTEKTDTIYSYNQIKILPSFQVHYSDIYDPFGSDILMHYQNNPEYFHRNITDVISYTQTEITRPVVYKGTRKLAADQLVFEILIAMLLSIILLFFMILRNSRQIAAAKRE
jgi:hypothetical protein